MKRILRISVGVVVALASLSFLIANVGVLATENALPDNPEKPAPVCPKQSQNESDTIIISPGLGCGVTSSEPYRPQKLHCGENFEMYSMSYAYQEGKTCKPAAQTTADERACANAENIAGDYLCPKECPRLIIERKPLFDSAPYCTSDQMPPYGPIWYCTRGLIVSCK